MSTQHSHHMHAHDHDHANCTHDHSHDHLHSHHDHDHSNCNHNHAHDHSNCGHSHQQRFSQYNPLALHFKEYEKPQITQQQAEKLKQYEEIEDDEFIYVTYSGETQMKLIQDLCSANLSEPYSVFTYRYFVNKWPYLTYLAMDKKNGNKCVGLIVAQLKEKTNTGYIAMLVVDKSQRRKGLGTKLVSLSINKMIKLSADSVMLETEIDNFGALKLYEKLGFIKDYKYRNYYLNGNGAFRLKLYLNQPQMPAKYSQFR